MQLALSCDVAYISKSYWHASVRGLRKTSSKGAAQLNSMHKKYEMSLWNCMQLNLKSQYMKTSDKFIIEIRMASQFCHTRIKRRQCKRYNGYIYRSHWANNGEVILGDKNTRTPTVASFISTDHSPQAHMHNHSVGWAINVPFKQKIGYIRDKVLSEDLVPQWYSNLPTTSLFVQWRPKMGKDKRGSVNLLC